MQCGVYLNFPKREREKYNYVLLLGDNFFETNLLIPFLERNYFFRRKKFFYVRNWEEKFGFWGEKILLRGLRLD